MIVVFDLDGTLADCEHRIGLVKKLSDGKKPDWDEFFRRCVDDKPIWPVIEVMKAMSYQGHWVEIWSGRSEVVMEETKQWLARHGMALAGVEGSWGGYKYRRLRMRPKGNYTPDHQLKAQWFEEVDQDWRPQLVFDDRKRLVDMWRSKGVICAQVAEGEF